MTGITWGYNLGAKGGQSAKEKKDGETVVTDKSADLNLRVRIKGDETEQCLQEIIESVGDIEECTITIPGAQKTLETKLKKIAKIIAENGGQETLDIHISEKEKAEVTTS